MKKVSSILVILLIFNFIFSSFTFAVTDNSEITYSEESFNQLVDNGTVSIDGETEEVSETQSSTASMVGTQTSTVSSFFVVATTLLRIFANEGGFYYTDSNYSAENIGWFSINSLVFGEYLLFNANVYQTNESLNPNIESTAISRGIDGIKNLSATLFQILRYFAIILIVVLLIFTGLRLAVSDLAEDRARYKEVLKSWAVGLLFIALLPQIIVIINTICGYFMDILWNARVNLENAGYSSFESELFMQCINGTAETGGLTSAAYFIEFLAFVIMDYKFFFKYIFRSFRIFALVIIAPIMGVLHIFFKISGKEGCIGNWFSKYITNYLMQPLHALLYLIFMFTASNIALNAPLLAVLFLWALSRAEKIFEIILEIDFGKVTSLFSRQ